MKFPCFAQFLIVDEPTFGRVVAQFPVDSPELKFLANAIEPLKPAYASRLRGAAP